MPTAVVKPGRITFRMRMALLNVRHIDRSTYNASKPDRNVL